MKELFEIPLIEELDEFRISSMVTFLLGTIEFAAIDDSTISYDISDDDIIENYANVYFGHVAPFNELWKPKWRKLYDRYIKFQTDNPGSIEWPRFNHSKKLEFIVNYNPQNENNSVIDYPNEYSDYKPITTSNISNATRA